MCGYVVNGSCPEKNTKRSRLVAFGDTNFLSPFPQHTSHLLSRPVMQFLFSLAHNPLWQMCRYCYYYFSLSSSAPCVYGRWRVVVVSNKWISGNHQGISSSLNNTTFFRSGKSNCWQNFDSFLCALFSSSGSPWVVGRSFVLIRNVTYAPFLLPSAGHCRGRKERKRRCWKIVFPFCSQTKKMVHCVFREKEKYKINTTC